MLEFKITPFEPDEFETLSLEAYGESLLSVLPLPADMPAFIGQAFENGRLLYFFTFLKCEQRVYIITSTGIFDKSKDPLPYFRRVLNFLHEAGAQSILIEIPSDQGEQIAGVIESGFSPYSRYEVSPELTMLQFFHNPGGRTKTEKEALRLH